MPHRGKGQEIRDKDRSWRMWEKGKGTRERRRRCVSQRDKGQPLVREETKGVEGKPG